ncbi:MAG: hypothetical protein WDO69_08870 [Pseudomonadota bacterium]
MSALAPIGNKATLSAELAITKSEDQYVAELRVEGGKARVFSAPGCDALIEAAAVVLALVIDPRGSLRFGAAPDRQVVLQPPPATQPSPALAYHLGAGTALDTSTLPHAAGGVFVRGGLAVRRWSLSLQGTDWLPASGTAPGYPQAGGRFKWWTIGLTPCFTPIAASRFAWCLGPELGRLRGVGFGVEPSRAATATWLAIAFGPAWELRLSSRLAFRVGAGVAVTVLGRHPFVLETSQGASVVHTSARLSGRANLGLELYF